MTNINASMVKELREKTGVSMMKCKQALVDSNGDIDQAIEVLRKAGQKTAAGKGSRTTAEGLVQIATSLDNKSALLLEVNSETDFVAREAQFKEFVINSAKAALESAASSVAELASTKLPSGQTIEETRLSLVAQLGENITVRRLERYNVDQGIIGSYLHGGQDSARIASFVAIDSDNLELAKDLAMQVAAMKPQYLDEGAIPSEVLAKEQQIFLEETKTSQPDKPSEMLEKIVAGKLKKFIKELTLVDQPFVKDGNQTISKLLAANSSKITYYTRFEVGEGIEKKQENFAEEVMAQVNN